MTKKITSIVLAVMMVVSMMSVMAFSANAVGEVVSEEDYLTFTAEEANSSVTLEYRSCDYLQYNKNDSGWKDYSQGTQITLENVGDYVRFSGSGTSFNEYNHVSLTGKVACSGNVMSLRLNGGKSQGLSSSCFQYMFDYCEELTTAPELPEKTLATSCYFSMFRGCTSLTKAPVLPATTLAKNCYRYMFRACENLTELPALPATTLAQNCYAYMFYGCLKIRISDQAGTFDGITYSAEYRIPSTGTGTPVEDALDDMFGGTGGKFTGTPNINTTYYLPAPAPSTYTVTWKNGENVLETDTDVAKDATPEYNGATPTKTDDSNNIYTFSGWTPAVSAVTGDVTYTATFTSTPAVAKIGDAKYETLAAAIAAAPAGATVKLLENVTLSEALVIPDDKSFTLDLNGKDITGNVNDKMVQNNGTVVVDDTSAAPGHIYNTNIDKQGNAAFVNYGTATVKNGYFGDKNSDMTDANDVNRGAGFQNYGTAVIDGGYFTACDNFTNTEGTGSGYAYAIINYGTITVNDATVYGKNNGNLANNEGTMTVNGGNFTLTKGTKQNYYSIYNGTDNAHSIVNGGTFNNTTGKALAHTGVGTTELKGGSFTFTKFEQSTTGHPTVSGGSFNKAVPAAFCADGYKPTPKDETTGMYTVAIKTLQDYVDDTFGNITGFTFADDSADIDGISANSASLVGVQIRKLPADTQTTEYSYDEEGKKEAGLRFVATMSKALYDQYKNAEGFDYGFDINGHKFSCKDSANNVAEGHEDIRTASDYAVMTLALKGFNDSNKDTDLNVKFFVKTAADGTVYADYAKVGSTAKEFTTTYNQVEAHI